MKNLNELNDSRIRGRLTIRWVCVNANSYYCTDWTDYDFCCEDWEGRNT